MTLPISDAFRMIVAALGATDVSYCFIGALPVLAWGRVRATMDVDLVASVSEGQLEEVTGELLQRGFSVGAPVGPHDSADPCPDIAVFWYPGEPSVRLDFFVAKTDFEHAVLQTAVDKEVLGLSIRLATAESSIIYKLLAARSKDIEDIESIFETRRSANGPLDWEFLHRWAGYWDITERLKPYQARYGP